MNFKPELLKLVLEGKKTQTRRPVKDGQWVHLNDDGEITSVQRTKVWGFNKIDGMGQAGYFNGHTDFTVYSVGNTYAIAPGRGKKAVARFELLQIRREDVRKISKDDAIAEGFETEVDFWRVWCGFYDPKALPLLSRTDTYVYLFDRQPHLYDAWALTFEVRS